jgi:hypothetical protein
VPIAGPGGWGPWVDGWGPWVDGWGPWVDGGGWLRVGGEQVDWILRDLDRVRQVWHDCQAGRFEVGQQRGHPLGFYSPCYAGEVALGRVLADPGGELSALPGRDRDLPAVAADRAGGRGVRGDVQRGQRGTAR